MRQKLLRLLSEYHTIAALGAVAFIVIVVVIVLAVTMAHEVVPGSPPVAVANLSRTPDPETGEVRVDYNILLLGYGGAGHDGGSLTDVIKVVNLNPDTKKLTVISVPRDLWVPIPVRSDAKEHFKINTAYAIGGDDGNYPLKQSEYKGENGANNLTKRVVSEVTGMPIDHVIAVDFAGFVRAIDEIGGIDVAVPVAFDDYFYPVKGLENETCGASAEEIADWHAKYSGFELEKQFTCRYEHLHFDAGKSHMDGSTALKFVRSRHSDQHGGDFARAERQMALMYAVKDKALSLKALDNIPGFAARFTGSIHTDLDPAMAAAFVAKYPDVAKYSVSEVVLSTDNVLRNSTGTGGQFILVPKAGTDNWTELQEFVEQQLK